MKVSDIITLVAVLAGGASAYFAYDSWTKYAGKPFDDAARKSSKFTYIKKSKTRAPLVPTRINRQGHLTEKEGVFEDETSQLADLTKKRNDLQGANGLLQEEILKATGEKQGLQDDIRAKKRDISANDERIQELKEKSAASGTPEDLKTQVQDNIARLRQAEQALQIAKQELESTLQYKGQVEGTLAGAKEVERKQTAGEMNPGFRTTVQEVYGRWGFIVINGGSSAGVNARTKLTVVRGGVGIAQLQVTTVEPGVAVCAIIDGTVAEGVTVAPGDTVLVTPVAVDTPVTVTAPAES